MFKYFRFLAICLLPAIGFVSCGPDEPDPVPNSSESSANDSDPISQEIKRNISASVSYSDFGWNISIRSKLADVFPGKSLVYGTECGYGSYDYYQHFTFKTAYMEKTDGRGNMEIYFPLFVGNEYGGEWLYYSSYKELQYMKANGITLDSEERDLYNSIVEALKSKESAAKATYCGRLYVIVDNTKYFYHTYGQTPSNSGGSNTGGGGSSGGGSSSYEKPELSFVDYDCNTTSLTAKFRIDNQSKAKVTSVKGYYGKSSANISTSASLSGSLITVRVSGLTKGTTYYIKCSATGPGGTATSSQVKLSTLY